MFTCRVIIEQEPKTGEQNMQRDEELLVRAIEHHEVWLRFYRWCEPTISLGHFQKLENLSLPEKLANLPQVRRLSGGGAILHDQELTYSIVIPADHPISQNPNSLYDLIHDRWINVLQQLSFPVQKRGIKEDHKEGNFLCFLRGDPRDLLLGEHKILGSAQRRRKGAILQHGSLLLHASSCLPEIPGLFDLQPNIKDFNEIAVLPELFYKEGLETLGAFIPD